MDVSCFEDLDLLGTELDESNPLLELAQDNFHRVIENPGSNPDDPDRGLGIQRFLSGSASDIESVPSLVEAELRKDARNADVKATLERVATGIYHLTYVVVPDADELGVTSVEPLITKLRLGPGTEVARL